MVHTLSSAMIRVATSALPAGAVRERYRQEFLADLHVFDRRVRLAFAFGILVNAFALRSAVRPDVVAVAERDFAMVLKPALCRLHLHFRVRCVNAERDVYHRCRRCGDDQYEYEREWDGNNVAANLFGGNLNGGTF